MLAERGVAVLTHKKTLLNCLFGYRGTIIEKDAFSHLQISFVITFVNDFFEVFDGKAENGPCVACGIL